MDGIKLLDKTLKKHGVDCLTVYKIVDFGKFELEYGTRLKDESMLDEWQYLKNCIITSNRNGLVGDKDYCARAVILLPFIDEFRHILILRSKKADFLLQLADIKTVANIVENYVKKYLG